MKSWDAFASLEPEMAEKGRDLLYQRGDGEGLIATVARNGIPRIHVLNAGIHDGRLLVFVQAHSAKARDLEATPVYALHAHQDPARPDEFMVRGEARPITNPAIREGAAASWFFAVSESYPLYELLIDHAVLGERASPDDWPPKYRVWRSES